MTVENTEVTQDETANFVTTTSDMPEVKQEPKVEANQDEPASSEDKQPESEVKTEGEEQVDGNNTAAESEEPKKKGKNFQKRIDEVVRQREEEKLKREALERELQELKSGKQQEEKKAEVKEPVESDFNTYDEYLDAVEAYESQESDEKKATPKEEPKEPQGQDEEMTDSQKVSLALLQEKVNNAESKPEDFDTVALDPELTISSEMVEGLAECDDPIKVMYHLGQNKELAAEIAGKSPAQQIREIVKLDLTVKSKPPKPTKVTEAPDPINPVRGQDAQQKPVSEMSFAEYEEYMNGKEQKANGSSW